MANNNTKNSVHNTKNGRYVLGGLTEVSTARLEWWERRKIPADPSDILYYVEAAYAGRPDLLGYMFYGDPLLWWVIGLRNGILDPLEELVDGKLLVIPTIETVKTYLKNPPPRAGGVKAEN